MQTSDAGKKFIQNNEGLRLVVYKDQNGNSTVGWGHLARSLHPGEQITMGLALSYFNQDIAVVEKAINNLVKVEINQNQYDALADFVFNVGEGRFSSSHVLAYTNEQKWEEAADAFLMWDKPKGIINRRIREKKLFLLLEGGALENSNPVVKPRIKLKPQK